MQLLYVIGYLLQTGSVLRPAQLRGVFFRYNWVGGEGGVQLTADHPLRTKIGHRHRAAITFFQRIPYQPVLHGCTKLSSQRYSFNCNSFSLE